MADFASLKRSRQDNLTKLNEQLNKLNPTVKSSGDDRFWYPNVDKTGNGFAVIRFLPAPANEDVPFIRLWQHSFKGPMGKWYIENSLTTINKADPVSEYNTQLWNSTTDDNSPARKQARDQKRKLTYIANVYIVKDPANPENEGQVKLFKFGKKMFDKLNEAMNPRFEDEKPLNPFDLWDGANFKIKIRTVDSYRNYDKSEFADPEPLMNDDGELESIWKKEYSLQEFLNVSNFKDYDVLKKKLNEVLGLSSKAVEEELEELPRVEAPKLKAKAPKQEEEAPWASTSSEDDDDEDLSYFKRLADD